MNALHTLLIAVALLLCSCVNNTPQIAAKAASGDPAAGYEYGRRLLTGHHVSQNQELAVKWFLSAADKGSIRAAAALGACYTHGLGTKPDVRLARYWYGIAADAGHPYAELALAAHYMQKQPTNPRLAVQYIRYAAMQGSPDAAFLMSLCFAEGYGVPTHPRLAMGWLVNAAELGHETALTILKDVQEASAGTPNSAKKE